MTFDRAHPPQNDDPTMRPWIEHWSYLPDGTREFLGWYRWPNADVAQSVERHSAKMEVAGPSPAARFPLLLLIPYLLRTMRNTKAPLVTRRHTVELSVLAALLLFFCLACARRPENVTPRPAPGRDTQTVDYVTHIISSMEWESTQWYRIGDDVGTVGFFVVSDIGSICLSQDGSWVLARHGNPFECKGGWRSRSNSIGGTGSRISR